MLGFVWDSRKIEFCCHLMKLSLIFLTHVFIIDKIMIILYFINFYCEVGNFGKIDFLWD
jgi:hypothetical protein